ncbi:response regulator [Lysobacter sp. TY2-98]|uniref:response regulator n=1 Tax=Lysobacter sp. TY2-98 TaxID=2290922 RepID=UPI000E2000E2|nr:two-component system response regulator [Lysobacter sp. TY2-98]AXK71778.1 response regulator [Lysobacter sp. TY2-98]
MDEHDERATILAVDDTPENLALISGLLRHDYRVKVAPDGERALQIAHAAPPDIILLDIMMPGMDGYEVMRRLQADAATAQVPVIFLTAMAGVDDERKGLELGAVDYITKPISPSITLARVRNHLQLKRVRDFLQDQNAFLEQEVALRTRQVARIQDVTIRAMASLAETRDNETGNHILRTQHYVRRLAQQLAEHPRFTAFCTPSNIDLLFKSAPLHDIGKVGVPDRILLKPGKLTDEEFEVMKTHTTLGKEAIERALEDAGEELGFLEMARDIAYSHQEKWDGSGYPLGLAGDDIPICGRLMAVADVYDALISRRVYKEPMRHEDAVGIIVKGRGQHFDPDIVDAFIALEDECRHIAEHFIDSDREMAIAAQRTQQSLGDRIHP